MSIHPNFLEYGRIAKKLVDVITDWKAKQLIMNASPFKEYE